MKLNEISSVEFPPVCHCGNRLEIVFSHPPIYDPVIKSWKLDENGVIIKNKTKPKTTFHKCSHHGGNQSVIFM